MFSVRKLVPAVVLAMSLAPFAANARSSRPPLPPVSSAAQTYTFTAFSELHGRAAERAYTQPASQDVSVAQQFWRASPSNAAPNTAGG
jgi:hypothetical protein